MWVVGEELLGEEDVAGQRFEDVLPGADGEETAIADGLAGEEAPDQVGDEAIRGVSLKYVRGSKQPLWRSTPCRDPPIR